jgi:hypothetical protein
MKAVKKQKQLGVNIVKVGKDNFKYIYYPKIRNTINLCSIIIMHFLSITFVKSYGDQ